MKTLKMILFFSVFLVFYGCANPEEDFISTVEVKIKDPSPSHAFIIEVNAVEQPQHMDFVAKENANLFLTDKHQKVTIELERNLVYNIKVYRTFSSYRAEIKKGNYRPYMNDLIYENEQSFDSRKDVLIIEKSDTVFEFKKLKWKKIGYGAGIYKGLRDVYSDFWYV